MRLYMKRRYHRRMNEYRERFGGECKVCGSKNNLQFDHIDRRTKSAVIATIWNKPKSVIESELKKCQLLCEDCHLEKGRKAGDVLPATTHGKIRKYQNGCRCELCRAEASRIGRKYRPTQRQTKYGEPQHGSRTRYNKGCKCALCRAAQSEYMRRYNHARSLAAKTADS